MTDVRMTIGGVEVPVLDVSYSFSRRSDVTVSVPPRRLVFTSSMTTTISGDAFDRFMAAVSPPDRGASIHTLARRAHYGGRKGRRAFRRLRARGYVGILYINDERRVGCRRWCATRWNKRALR